MRPSFLIILFFIRLYLPVVAQTSASISYDAGDGLAANNYMGIFQDSRGVLWVGSYGSGVSRFDGIKWENWTQADKIFNNLVLNIFEDKQGGLWFDHHVHGISRLKDGQWQCFDFQQDTCPKGVLRYDRRSNTVYIFDARLAGKTGSRIFKYDDTARQFIDSGADVLPRDIAGRYDGSELWSGVREKEWWIYAQNIRKQSIDYYHIDNRQIRRLPAPPAAYEDYFRFLYTNAVLTREAGDAVGHSAKGVFVLKDQRWVPFPPPELPRYSNAGRTPKLVYKGCAIDERSGSLFIVWYLPEENSLKRYLLAEYDAASLRPRQTLLFSNPFWDLDINHGRRMIKDAAGTIWILTPGNVLRLFPGHFQIPATTPGMPSQAWAVAQSREGNIWLASFGGGLVQFDGLDLKPFTAGWKRWNKFNDGSFTDENGYMYFNSATEPTTGILRTDGTNDRELLAGNKGVVGFFIGRDKKGRLLWGTSEKGLWILPKGKPGRDTADWLKIDRTKGLLLHNVLTALEDRYGRYWMGRTSQGIALYDPGTPQTLNWLRSQDSQNYGCMSMTEDSRGNLWFGTDRGLCFLENRREIGPGFDLKNKLLPVGAGLTGTSVVTVCQVYNAHTLIVGNAAGLFLLDLDAFYSHPRRVYLQSLHPKNGYDAGPVVQNAVFIDRDSGIWVIGAKGAFRYDPRVLPRDTATPAILVERLVAGRDTFSGFSGPLTLSSEQRYVEIYFRHSTNPMLYDNIRFEYRFAGDSVWGKIASGAASLAFPSLNAGAYRFEIRAVKEGRVSAPVAVEFRILPVWWERPLFWLLATGLVVGISALWWRRELRIADQHLQISNQNLLLEKDKNEMARLNKEKDKLQVQALVNQLNPHFINNTLQWLQVRMDDDEEAVRVMGKLSENIGVVFNNSRMGRSYHTLREEMQLTENYLFIQQRRFGDKLNYEMPGSEILDKLGHLLVPLMMVQIHAENAVEHGIRNKKNGRGTVKIELWEEAEYAVVIIEDDGVGRSAAKEIGSRGTQNGTAMLKELQMIYNRQNRLPLEQYYEDDIRTDAGAGRHGTRAIVRIPKDYQFEF